MSEFSIKTANPSDLNSIHSFLASYFHNKEPLESSHIDKTDKMEPDDDFLLCCINCGTTLMAVVDDKLVAVLIAGLIVDDEAERNLECAKSAASTKVADILRFLSYIERKADFCRRLAVPSCLHIHIIGVHPAYQGRGIAKQLFEVCLTNGSIKKFPALSSRCSNAFTAKIAEKFQMTCISRVTYDEYNQVNGREVFVPKEPHTVIKSYAKVFRE